MKIQEAKYIGDGVYVSNDGYQLWLRVGSHLNPPLIALDLDVFNELCQYGKDFFATPQEGNNE